MTEAKIVVVGGGSGNYNVLAGFTRHLADLTAIVAMSDSGGSSGRLRDELGQLPYGDIRQCLIALAGRDGNDLFRNLFAHRFSQDGDLKGHSVGNLLLAALTEITGGAERAIEVASELLKIRGAVLPVTLTRTHLHAMLTDGTVLERESTIDTYGGKPGVGIDYVYLKPLAYSHAPAVRAIEQADLIVLSPGDLYTSLIPNLLVEGVADAFFRSSATVVLVCNLMTKPGETDGFLASNLVSEADKYLGKRNRIDLLLVNSDPLPELLIQRYAREHAHPIALDREASQEMVGAIVETPLLSEGPYIRHDPAKLADALMSLLPTQGTT